MGYKRDGFVFRGKSYGPPEAVRNWLSPDFLRRDLLGPLEAGGYLARAEQVSVAFAPPEPIRSVADLYARASTWGYDIVTLFAGDQNAPDFQIFLGLDPSGPRWGIGAIGGAEQFRAGAADWVAAWAKSLASVGLRFAHARFECDRSYPRPVPPRVNELCWPGALDYYLGREWHRTIPEAATILDALETAPLPPNASRSSRGDVLHIAFAADLADPASVAAARAAQERWITPLVDARIELGWNELGDCMLHPAKTVVLEPFTLYDEWNHIGYKALVIVPPDDWIDEEAWSQLAAIARAGALPDGTPVKSVRLIFATREHALKMHDRALASGFELTAYGQGNAFWQVHPKPPGQDAGS